MRHVAWMAFVIGLGWILGARSQGHHHTPPPRVGKDGSFRSMYELEIEHRHGIRHLNVAVLRTDLAVQPNVNLHLEFPVVGRVSDDTDNNIGKAIFDVPYGLGGFVVEPAMGFHLSDHWTGAAAMRVELDTSTRDELGEGGTLYTPTLLARYQPHDAVWLAPMVRYTVANGLDHSVLGTSKRNELSVSSYVVYEPNKKWVSWVALQPEIIEDFEHDWTDYRLAGEYGKYFTDTFGAYLRVEGNVGADERDLDVAFKVGFRKLLGELFSDDVEVAQLPARFHPEWRLR